MTTRDEWLTKAKATMKGVAFDDKSALQCRINGPGSTRPVQNLWRVFMQVDHADPAKAEAQAFEDIRGGADGLVLVRPDYAAALAKMPLHKIALRNDAADDGAVAIRNIVESQSIDPARLDVDFATTDLGFVHGCVQSGFRGPFMRVDGRAGHANGLSDAQELGVALAFALQRFRQLEKNDDALIARAVSVTLVATQDTFATLAKFRSMRLLWASLLRACDLPDTPLALHAETSRTMYADVDAHTNILRAVSAATGAGLGGADSISILPFSQQQGIPNSFARRVARNAQNVLLHESNLWRVSDPAAGAGAIERKTQLFCEEAWHIMQKAEEGDWPVANRDKARCMPIVGVTKYQPAKPQLPEIESAS